MKVISTLIALIFLVACRPSNNDTLLGRWSVSTPAFQAVYQIQKGERGYDCQVISYNDGTTIYAGNSHSKPYVFKNVLPEVNSSTDGSTGATNTKKSSSNSHKIRVIDAHQLEVVSQILNQKKTEIWTRVH